MISANHRYGGYFWLQKDLSDYVQHRFLYASRAVHIISYYSNDILLVSAIYSHNLVESQSRGDYGCGRKFNIFFLGTNAYLDLQLESIHS